jgi:hypothetical protein
MSGTVRPSANTVIHPLHSSTSSVLRNLWSVTMTELNRDQSEISAPLWATLMDERRNAYKSLERNVIEI